MDIQTSFGGCSRLLNSRAIKINEKSGLPTEIHNNYSQVLGILNRFFPSRLDKFIDGSKSLEECCSVGAVTTFLTTEYPDLFVGSSFETGTYLKTEIFDKSSKGLKNNPDILDIFVLEKGMRLSLSGINLSNCDLTGIDLSYVDLSFADFTSAVLCFANLEGANLCYAALNDADLLGVNLIRANLIAAKLRKCNLTLAKLCIANCSRADFYDVVLLGANLLGTNLSDAYLEDGILSEAYLFGAISADTNVQMVINKHNNEFKDFGNLNKIVRLERS